MTMWKQLLAAVAHAAALVSGVIDLRDILFFGGMAAVCYGAALIYPPASWIIGGIASVLVALKSGTN